jgi:hypothetical protein
MFDSNAVQIPSELHVCVHVQIASGLHVHVQVQIASGLHVHVQVHVQVHVPVHVQILSGLQMHVHVQILSELHVHTKRLSLCRLRTFLRHCHKPSSPVCVARHALQQKLAPGSCQLRLSSHMPAPTRHADC